MAKQIDKGIKISLPDPPMRVTRGYIALLSPYVYMTQALHGGAGDDAGFVEELARLHSGFEFLSGKAKLPPLSVAGNEIGNTKDDPANAEKRKGKFMIEAFKHGGGKKPSAKAQISFVVPPGFIRVTEGVRGGALVFAAQDKDNNNVLIVFTSKHATELPARMVFQSPREQMEGWKSNWEGQARGTGKIRDKNKNMQLGNIKAKGYVFEGMFLFLSLILPTQRSARESS